MANLNLYAQKVFAEHPLALWALDDQADYISLISNGTRDLNSWNLDSCQISNESNIPDNIPFSNSHLNIVEGIMPSIPGSGIFYATMTSPVLVTNQTNLDQSKSSFSIGFYFNNKLEAPISSLSFGFSYVDPTTLNTIEELKSFTRIGYGLSNWEFFSNTFTYPQEFNDLKIVIKVGMADSGSYSTMKFFINGISFAQYAEEFIATSLGVENTQTLSGISTLNNHTALLADAYGLDDVSGYYLVNDTNDILAKNYGIPIVYGASNATYLKPNSNKPSLIIPGYGMLNELGRYREYTFECWLRIDTNEQGSKRIFGPVASTDGLYIDGPFVRLEIGNSAASYFISEVARPMLINIKIFENGASLLINAEEVIRLEFNTQSLSLPAKLDQLGNDQDWLGFYSYDNVEIALDCIAIYSYSVPSIMLKRRFAYGQAVEFPENANTNYGGTAVVIDYPSADYTNNYSYPTIGKWEQGILQNIASTNNTLSVPQYTLPTIDLKDGKTVSDWENYLYNKQAILENNPKNKYIEFDEFVNFMYFDSMSVLLDDVKSLYGIFGISQYSNNEKILFRLENKINKSYILVTVKNDILKYSFVSNNESITLREEYLENGSQIFVGFDIDAMSIEFGQFLKEFFGNKSQISVYVGGYKNIPEASFDGKIYKIAFSNNANYQKIKNQFLSVYSSTFPSVVATYNAGDAYFGNDPAIWSAILDGGNVSSFAEQNNFDLLFDHVASYTLIPKFLGTSMSVDISCNSYWEDFIPLSYFGKYTKNIFNENNYTLDFLQFNIGYPLMEDLSQSLEYYDTELTSLKSYVTFQYLSSGANTNYSYFSNSQPIPQNGVVIPGDNWMTTKYEVTDGTIIYVPNGVAFQDLAIVTHLELNVSGILKSPVAIKSLQYASQALDASGVNPIKTKFGVDLYPYVRFGQYFDYKARNPVKIYRGASPYLYLTNKSGIELVGDFSNSSNRGVSIPINKQLSSSYKVVALQTFAKYNKTMFPENPVQIFEIKTANDTISFAMEAVDADRKRARIYPISTSSSASTTGFGFYLNGKLVKDIYINANQWFVLGIDFATPLAFDGIAGAIRITGPLLVNNLSYYQTFTFSSFPYVYDPAIGKTTQLTGVSYLRYNGGLLVDTPKIFVPNSQDIYSIYTGTRRSVIDDNATSQIGQYEYNIYKDLSWQRQVAKPV